MFGVFVSTGFVRLFICSWHLKDRYTLLKVNFRLCQLKVFLFPLRTAMDLYIKWHKDGQDGLFKDLLSTFPMFVCVYFCPGAVSQSSQFVYLWKVNNLICPEKQVSCSLYKQLHCLDACRVKYFIKNIYFLQCFIRCRLCSFKENRQ